MQQFVQQSRVCLSVSGNRLPQPSSCGAFVINLGSSSTPVALSSPDHPELKKFTFFVSRRREDGRERFRLHMGYFETQQDAEVLLEIVREIYPGAWAGVGPGRKPPATVPLPPAAAAVIALHAEPVVAPALSAPLQELQLELEPAPPAQLDEHFATEQSLSSVRAAIAALADDHLPASGKSAGGNQPGAVLSHTETIKLLETPSFTAPPARPLPRPENVAAYVVQLRWSTRPIGMSELPPLAIFDAYTMYCARGRHDGSQWHALRLGFFNDQVSADQVASYIRSEFGEVTVVPVGSAERDSAMAASASAAAAMKPSPGSTAPGATPAAVRTAKVDASSERANGATNTKGAKAASGTHSSGLTGQFKLIEDDVPPSAEPERLELMLTSDVATKPNAAKAPAGAAGKGGTRRPPASLEETLDVLGAGNLKLDGAKGELLNASGVRRMRHAADQKPQARSALSRLFDRLAESIGGGR